MTLYEKLLDTADSDHIIVRDKPLLESDGRIKGNRIAIRENMTSTEKACTLSEELGHYYTTVGDILDQSDSSNRKQEHRARIWAYNRMIGLLGLIDCFEAGCQNRYESAEHLGVTEEFLQDAVDAYRRRYGECVRFGDYIVFFEPCFGVTKNIDSDLDHDFLYGSDL